MGYAKSVEEYLAKSGAWEDALILLREIMPADLQESIKWGSPVYTVNGKNIIGLGAFKSYVGIWFFQGALLADNHNKLINAQEGTTKAMRQWRFQSKEEIEKETDIIRSYLDEAIANQREGKEIKRQRVKPLKLPTELKKWFSNNPDLKTAFDSLSLSNRRDYAEYITEAKKTETKHSRLEKIIPMIRQGVGLNDKYRK